MQPQFSFAECCKPACLQSELHVMRIGAKQLGLNEKNNVCLDVDMCVFDTKCKGSPVGCLFLTPFCYNSCNLNIKQNIAIFFSFNSHSPTPFHYIKETCSSEMFKYSCRKHATVCAVCFGKWHIFMLFFIQTVISSILCWV